jgi:hypothetical protein
MVVSIIIILRKTYNLIKLMLKIDIFMAKHKKEI